MTGNPQLLPLTGVWKF